MGRNESDELDTEDQIVMQSNPATRPQATAAMKAKLANPDSSFGLNVESYAYCVREELKEQLAELTTASIGSQASSRELKEPGRS